MCGIAGGARISKDTLACMLRSLQHRGPDGSGHHHSPTFAIGMTRLAILDPEHGQQPFSSHHIHAVCNGEIYNWKELRAELEQKGHRFRTHCDSEILPAAYLEWGTDLPSRLNGMFALAIHDAKNETLFLARDRCGQKPLYLTSPAAENLHFASEIKALAAAQISLIADPSQLSTWLTLRYLPEPRTLFKNIHTLPAAHWTLIRKNGTRQTTRYWKPQSAPPEPKANPVDTLDNLARSSVELALQSDVPIAAYLSGGVDSALLGHYLRDLGASPETVSLGFGAASDETPLAQETAKHLGLNHHPLHLTPESLADLPRVVSQMDLPIGDALILAFDALASHTTSLGAKVALGGEGPDEHFAGYSFQKSYLTARKLGPIGRRLAAIALASAPSLLLNKLAAFPASLGTAGRQKITTYLHDFTSLTPHQQLTSLHSLFSPAQAKELLNPDLLASQAPPPEPDFDLSSLSGVLATQYSAWLPDWSLIRQDRNTMAHSLEYRAPFLDHRLIDFAFTLPDAQKINRGTDKHIWRTLASRHLPKNITHRPKQPFYLPLESPAWSTPLLKMAHDLLAPQNFTCHGLLNPKAVKPLLHASTFLPLKQLAAITILQLWLDQHLPS